MIPAALLKADHKTGLVETVKGHMPEAQSLSEVSKRGYVEGLKPTITQNTYISRVEQIQQHIAEGRYYELNFTHQLQGHWSGSPYGLYQNMRDAGPVPFGAFLQLDNLAVCCISPERFLHKKGNRVISQPIKGTINRGNNLLEDNELKNKLKRSIKDRAENLMIVDLVRNDLSRIAQKGSIIVSDLFEIQSFGTVHQMVSTISGIVYQADPIRILEACFPMGSMTGAPKISVMQTIEQVETYKRGIYSGAIGYISPRGDFDFNVVIRTAILREQQLFYAVGGAITADSCPQAEWEESWLKAQALQKAFQKVPLR